MSNPSSRRPRQADGGSSTEWMVTFSDCMTLLLTFFVMLLSFSSFNPKAMTRVHDTFEALAKLPGVSSQKRMPKDSPVNDDDREVDWTEEGTETPTDSDRIEPTLRPRAPVEPLGNDAYRDRRVLTVPSDLLFWGCGTTLKPQARDLLGRVAEYLRMVPCRVVVSETDPAAPGGSLALERAWALVRHFAQAEKIDAGRFAIAPGAGAPDGAGAARGQAAVRITMLNARMYP
ncbi:MAG: hypothetical protein IMZ66_11170 [Planctomycetes bacterium]|nr:hypothetical protein [Planctomycetota bacterium]